MTFRITPQSRAEASYAISFERDTFSPERAAHIASNAVRALAGSLEDIEVAGDWETLRIEVSIPERPALLPAPPRHVEVTARVSLL